jgi:hypothetical protein
MQPCASGSAAVLIDYIAVGCYGNGSQQGVTGLPGVNFGVVSAGSLTGTSLAVNFQTTVKQSAVVGATGLIYMYGAPTGSNPCLSLTYTANVVPGWTGVKWPAAVTPTLSGYTGSKDFINLYFDGVAYYGSAIPGY